MKSKTDRLPIGLARRRNGIWLYAQSCRCFSGRLNEIAVEAMLAIYGTNLSGTISNLADSLAMFDAPKRPASHPDRRLECQEVMDWEFHALLDNIIAAGRGPEEVALAIHELTNAHMMARYENAVTDVAVKRIRRSRRPTAIH